MLFLLLLLILLLQLVAWRRCTLYCGISLTVAAERRPLQAYGICMYVSFCIYATAEESSPHTYMQACMHNHIHIHTYLTYWCCGNVCMCIRISLHFYMLDNTHTHLWGSIAYHTTVSSSASRFEFSSLAALTTCCCLAFLEIVSLLTTFLTP